MAREAKLSVDLRPVHRSEVGGIGRHNERTSGENHSNPDIDPERTKLNYSLVDKGDKTLLARVDQRIKEGRTGAHSQRKLQKNAVLLQSIVVQVNQEYFKSIGPEETRRFFEKTLEHFQSKWGKENILSAEVHMDEKAPHMHISRIPLENGRMVGGEFRKKEMAALHTDLHRDLNRAGFKVLRGENTMPPDKERVSLARFKTQDLERREKELTSKERQLVEKAAAIENAEGVEKEVQKIAIDSRDSGLLGKITGKVMLTPAAHQQLQSAAIAGAAAAVENQNLHREVTDLKGQVGRLSAENQEVSAQLGQTTEENKGLKSRLGQIEKYMADPTIKERVHEIDNPHLYEYKKARIAYGKPPIEAAAALLKQGFELSKVREAMEKELGPAATTKPLEAAAASVAADQARAAAAAARQQQEKFQAEQARLAAERAAKEKAEQQKAAAEKTAKAQEWAQYLVKNPHVQRFLELRERGMSDKDAAKVMLMSGVDKKTLVSTIMAHSKNAPARSDKARPYAAAAVSKAEKELPKGAIPVSQEKPSQGRSGGSSGGSQAPAQTPNSGNVPIIRTDGKIAALTAKSAEEEIDWAALSPEEAQDKIAEMERKRDGQGMNV